MDLQKEHFRAYIFIEMSRGLKPAEIYKQLQQTNINIPSQTTIYDWYNRFKEGRHSLDDNERCGRPCSSTTDDNVLQIKTLIEENARQSVRAIADSKGINRETVRQVLIHSLELRKVCSVWVPHHLSESNKRDRVLCAQSIVNLVDTNSMDFLLQHWATEDESWILYETPLTKQQNRIWLHPSQPRPTIIRPQLTNRKVLLLLAFTGDKKFSVDVTQPPETITAERYTQFLNETGEKWRHVRKNPTKLKELFWQHDNARPHTARVTSDFVTRRQITLIRQSPYSPDLNQCDRWVFKFLKNEFRGVKFNNGEEVIQKTVQVLRSIPDDKFSREIMSLYNHCKKVINNNGCYVV